MFTVCAWCKKTIEETEPLEDKTITPGACAECIEKEWRELGEIIEDIKI